MEEEELDFDLDDYDQDHSFDPWPHEFVSRRYVMKADYNYDRALAAHMAIWEIDFPDGWTNMEYVYERNRYMRYYSHESIDIGQ